MVEGEVGALERMIRMIKKNGVFKVMQSMLIVVTFVYLLYNASNLPSIISDAFRNNSNTERIEHDAAVEARRLAKPKIDALLDEAMTSLHADRCFVLEMHNGTNNTAGLPFIYGEMTYECTASGVYDVDDDYRSLNLSRFDLPFYLEENHLFYGDVKSLAQIDAKLAKRVSSNDVTYIAITTMHGATSELGYFGITYCKNHKPADTKKIIETLMITSQKLSVLLVSRNVDRQSD